MIRLFKNRKKTWLGVFFAALTIFLALGAFLTTTTGFSPGAEAHCGRSRCYGWCHSLQDLISGTCRCSDVNRARQEVVEHHEQGETQMMSHMREQFHLHREWFVREYLFNLMPQSLMLMTEQMSAVAMAQMMVVGQFFDAKLHLEGQRLFNELQNEAAKDYQPSDSFCYFGTNTRSLSHSESLAAAQRASMSQIMLTRNLGNVHSAAVSQRLTKDKQARWDMFVSTYCDPHDNRWVGGTTGLVAVCRPTPPESERMNIDIDFGRLVDSSRYLDVDFNDFNTTTDEQDIISLANNLYGHDVPTPTIPFLNRNTSQHIYMRMRSIVAKRAVAQNTYNALVSMKSAGTNVGDSANYLFSLVSDLGMTNEDITEIFGEDPSYYGQLEILGKKMFQNADFFTDLQDKPMNVKRKQVALNAIELMLDRAIYESELRHEMLFSVLLSSYLEEDKTRDFYEMATMKK